MIYKHLYQTFDNNSKTHLFTKIFLKKISKKYGNGSLNLNLPYYIRSNLIIEWYLEFNNHEFFARFINDNNIKKVTLYNFNPKEELKHTCLNELEISSPTLEKIQFIGFNFCYSIDNNNLHNGHGYPLLKNNPKLKKVVFNGFNNVFEIIIEGFRKVYPFIINNPNLKIIEFNGFSKLEHIRGQNLELDQINLVKENFIKNCPSLQRIKISPTFPSEFFSDDIISIIKRN